MRRRTAIISGSILGGVVLLGGWAFASLSVRGDIWRGQEYLGRWLWFSLNEPQREDPKHLTSMADVVAHPEGNLVSLWCGYRLLVKQGIRLDAVPKESVVAALVPTAAFPRWCMFSLQPPVLVLHADGACWPMSMADLPLELR